MSNPFFDFARTIKVSPEQGHCDATILASFHRLDPIPILGIGDGLLNYSKDFPAVFGIDQSI